MKTSSMSLTVLCCAFLIGPAAAQDANTASDSSKVFDGLTIDELEEVVKEAGYTYDRVSTDGKENIDASTKDGLKFSFFLVDCPAGEKPKCASLNLSSFLFLESVNVTLRGVNEWNRTSWGVRGVLYTDGTSGMIMNLGLDGGVSRLWLKNRFVNFDYYLTSYSNFTQGIKAD